MLYLTGRMYLNFMNFIRSLSSFGFGTIILPVILSWSSCRPAGKSADKICSCSLSTEQMREELPIAAYRDSIVICKTGKIRTIGVPHPDISRTWSEFFGLGLVMAGGRGGGCGNITDCASGQELETGFFEYSVSYRDKKLVALSVYYYDSLMLSGEWLDRKQGYAYEELFYAKKGKIEKTPPRLVITPPYYSPEIIGKVRQHYADSRMNFKDNYNLHRRMFVAALNGDSLSKTVLLNYNPDPEQEKSLAYYIKMLREYYAEKKP
jgi:hypothetical protein